jgi:hypothetical protein
VRKFKTTCNNLQLATTSHTYSLYTGFVHIFDLHFILIQDKTNGCMGETKGKKKEKERLLV